MKMRNVALLKKVYIFIYFFFISVNVYFILNSICWTVVYDAHLKKKEEK